MKNEKIDKVKTCLILGTTSDIARAIAVEFAKSGYNLILSGRDLETTIRIGQDIQIKYSVEVKTIHLDILDLNSHKEFFEKLSEIPDGLVFAIGYMGEQKESERDFSEARKVIDTNFTLPLNILNHFANEFEKRKSGFIVGIGSVAGDRGRKKNYIYGASKAALHAYLSGLRNRLVSSNVQVLTVKPGFVRTKMTEHLNLPPKLTAEPEEIAKDTLKAFLKKKDILYSKKIYRYMLFIIKHIPEKIFKKLDL